jgi:PKD repeat protein
MRVFSRLGFLALLAFASSCTVKDTPIPDLAGPSELSLRVALQAVPDSILQDGFSQSSIQIEATGADGRPARGLSLRVQTFFQGVPQDFGTLSAKTVVTGDDGRARLTYTAPPRPAQPVEAGNIVTIVVEPIGTDYRGEISRTVDLRLVSPGILQPPNVAAPVANFTFSPAVPAILENVVFDASSSTDDGSPCGAVCTYNWSFGDGESASGIFTTHQYRSSGTYQVRLTVTDSQGASATVAKTVAVGQGTAPTATFNFSPTSPALGQTITFNAEASRAAAGRHIVSYDWSFGTGQTSSGITVGFAYSAPGTYQVTLTVTDDAGNPGTTTQSVTIGGTGGLQAVLKVSPPNGGTTATVFQFDGAESTRGANPIVQYRINFGDNTPDYISTVPLTTHQFTAAGTYQVSLQVTDSAGRTSVARISVGVSAPAAP